VRPHALLFAVAVASFATPSRADDERDYALFHYKKPADETWLRAVLEESLLMGLGFADDWRVSAEWRLFGRTYEWNYFRTKLVGKNQSFDTNPFDTNFFGHPLKGGFYYSAARSNRLPILASAALAIINSQIWEYLGEANQEASINDMIFTPGAGIPMGESLIQLAAYFDRQPPTFWNRALGTIFGPVKTAHDRFDGAELDRCSGPCGPWHRFTAAGSVAMVSQGRALHPQVAASLRTRIVNLPDYDAFGKHSHGWSEGNVSMIDLGGALGDKGANDAFIAFRALPVGWYASNMRAQPSGRIAGYSGFIGAAIEYEYRVHEWDLEGPQPPDQITHVSAGPSSELVLRVGGARIQSRLDASVGLAGVRAYALPKFRAWSSDAVLPAVVRLRGYGFAIGTIITPSVVVSYERVEGGVRGRFGFYRGILGAEEDQASLPFDVPRSDREIEGSVWLAWAATRAFHVVVSGRAAERSSSLDPVTDRRTELAVAMGTEVRF
jgi:hypothetical protein